jgi:hypothetical protein
MCVACGQELCKQCKGCHNSECERYTEPTEECEIDERQAGELLAVLGIERHDGHSPKPGINPSSQTQAPIDRIETDKSEGESDTNADATITRFA